MVLEVELTGAAVSPPTCVVVVVELLTELFARTPVALVLPVAATVVPRPGELLRVVAVGIPATAWPVWAEAVPEPVSVEL